MSMTVIIEQGHHITPKRYSARTSTRSNGAQYWSHRYRGIVMVDTFRPLMVTEEAIDDGQYYKSWVE
jgi:hypothetical protein